MVKQIQNAVSHLNNIHKLKCLSLCGCFVLSATPCGATTRGDDDRILDRALSYYAYDSELFNKNDDHGQFLLHVNQLGTAYLMPSKLQRPIGRSADGLPKEWKDVITFFKPGKGWTTLSLEEARELWGEPRYNVMSQYDFYTFDVRSKYGDETNLYHLDLRFGDDHVLKAYRIRGIGIKNPNWITQEDTKRDSPANHVTKTSN